jgi:hypothetical protein
MPMPNAWKELFARKEIEKNKNKFDLLYKAGMCEVPLKYE